MQIKNRPIPTWASYCSLTEKPNMKPSFLKRNSATPLQTLVSSFTMLSGPWLPPSIPTVAPTLGPHSTLAHAGRTSPCGLKHCGKSQRRGLLEAVATYKGERGLSDHTDIFSQATCQLNTSLARVKTNMWPLLLCLYWHRAKNLKRGCSQFGTGLLFFELGALAGKGEIDTPSTHIFSTFFF